MVKNLAQKILIIRKRRKHSFRWLLLVADKANVCNKNVIKKQLFSTVIPNFHILYTEKRCY